MNKTYISAAASIALLVSASAAFAGKHNLYNPNPAPLTIVNTISEVQGSVSGMDADNIYYPIAGDVYTTMVNGRTGETLGSFNLEGSVSATVTFGMDFMRLGETPWGELPATMPWSMQDDFAMNVGGSSFKLEESLTGRAFPHLGPVENPMETGTMALRMSGCAGVREVSGEGEYAGKVGTLCMNGTFTFDQYFNGKGVSNCSIAVHDPLQ